MWVLVALPACRSPAPPMDPTRTGTAAAIDLDPDPDTVEISLVAEVAEVPLDGVASEAWAYRDAGGDGPATVPGPLIDVPAGARLVVHLQNDLPESTTLHFHGIRLPNAMDGTDHTQPLVRPGEAFDYDFVVPDPATYWYHPHFETVDQVWKGLYGAVRATAGGPRVDADRVIVLSDISVDVDGRRVQEVAPEERVEGRHGDVVLVDGEPAPRSISAGRTERWRIVNASTARFLTLALADRPLDVIGTDAGPVAEPWTADQVRIGPGDRLELFVDLEDGETVELLTLPTDRADAVPIGETVQLVSAVGSGGRADGDGQGPIEPLPVPEAPAGAPVRTVTLASGVAPNGDALYTIDGIPWPFETPYDVPLDATEIWDVRNDTDADQSFHLHGFFFRVLDIDGLAPEHATLEDTAEIPRRGSARLLTTFDEPGAWMFHTHVLDHAELGMMSHVNVR